MPKTVFCRLAVPCYVIPFLPPPFKTIYRALRIRTRRARRTSHLHLRGYRSCCVSRESAFVPKAKHRVRHIIAATEKDDMDEAVVEDKRADSCIQRVASRSARSAPPSPTGRGSPQQRRRPKPQQKSIYPHHGPRTGHALPAPGLSSPSRKVLMQSNIANSCCPAFCSSGIYILLHSGVASATWKPNDPSNGSHS